jgi:ParB-like chromosome segregation protein Spo0J
MVSRGSIVVKMELRSIERIRPYAGNPRQNDQAVDAVAASLKQFGFRQPIVVDGNGVIIVGHTRWKAAKKLGLVKVPVHVARDLTAEQVKAYRIADNQTASIAEWDYELLPIELKELEAADFDLDVLAFDAAELSKLLDPDGTENAIEQKHTTSELFAVIVECRNEREQLAFFRRMQREKRRCKLYML